MPSPIFDSLILNLSNQIFDPRAAIGEADANHDYPQSLLVLALNRAVRDFVSALVEKESIENITKAIPEMIAQTSPTLSFGFGFSYANGAMPDDALKGISLIIVEISGAETLATYTSPERWHAITTEYNKEEIANRWTEWGGRIRINRLTNTSVRYLYIKNHTDLTAGGSADLTLNQRFYNQLLDLATEYIHKLSPVK